MADNNRKNSPEIILRLIGLGGPATFLAVWSVTDSVFEGILVTIFYAILLGFYSLLSKVWSDLEPEWVKKVSSNIRIKLNEIRPGYLYKYLESLLWHHRFLNTRGLGGTGVPYHVHLQQIFVNLKLRFYYSKDQFGEEINILELIGKSEKGYAPKIIILGDPGSGKTTLLRFLTLEYGLGYRKDIRRELEKTQKVPADLLTKVNLRKKIPFFLSFADNYRRILKNPAMTLPELIFEHCQEALSIKLPLSWIEKKLLGGNCAILFDGLDEIAEQKSRRASVDWLQKQIDNYNKCSFLITSREHGYSQNTFDRVVVLKVDDFDQEQIRKFCVNWYLADEVRKAEFYDKGLKREAEIRAEKLLKALASSKELASLAVNPLLLTMITIVFSVHENLPKKRVDLYREIIKVSLEQSYRNINIPNDRLSTLQKTLVLQKLAYFMMENGVSKISYVDVDNVVRTTLVETDPSYSVKSFLEYITQVSGLMIRVEEDVLQFAHKTFQEYLASTHIKDNINLLEFKLIENVGHEWWSETIRLYAAQTDATKIIEKCLNANPPKTNHLSLAIDILSEALTIEYEIRKKLQEVLDKLIEDPDPDRRRLIAEARLQSRIRFMVRADPRTWIDDGLISNIEYQLFVDEMWNNGIAVVPDTWQGSKFKKGDGAKEATGVRASDAIRFTEWLSYWVLGPIEFGLPDSDIAKTHPINDKSLTFWVDIGRKNCAVADHELMTTHVTKTEIEKILKDDLDRLKSCIEAREKKATPNKTAAQLLSEIVSIPGTASGISSSRKTVSSMDLSKNNLNSLQYYNEGIVPRVQDKPNEQKNKTSASYL